MTCADEVLVAALTFSSGALEEEEEFLKLFSASTFVVESLTKSDPEYIHLLGDVRILKKNSVTLVSISRIGLSCSLQAKSRKRIRDGLNRLEMGRAWMRARGLEQLHVDKWTRGTSENPAYRARAAGRTLVGPC